jgi:AcrR family transcriptional regulator
MLETTAIEFTPKAQKTRDHIFETALALFAKKGYQETTLRDIAAEAGCSLGLTYRYFARKEELILTLYERLADELGEQTRDFPKGPLAKRYGRTVQTCLDNLLPHREALGALFSVGLAPDSEVAVLGPRVAETRDIVWNIYLDVIRGSSEKVNDRQAQELSTFFYATHLLFVLFWLQDRSTGQQSTKELIKFAQTMLTRLRPVLGLPFVAKSLTQLVTIISPMFGPSA